MPKLRRPSYSWRVRRHQRSRPRSTESLVAPPPSPQQRTAYLLVLATCRLPSKGRETLRVGARKRAGSWRSEFGHSTRDPSCGKCGNYLARTTRALPGLYGNRATIHRQVDSSDEAALVGGKEHRGRCNLIRRFQVVPLESSSGSIRWYPPEILWNRHGPWGSRSVQD